MALMIYKEIFLGWILGLKKIVKVNSRSESLLLKYFIELFPIKLSSLNKIVSLNAFKDNKYLYLK